MQPTIKLFAILSLQLASVALAENNVESDDVPQACRSNNDCQSVFTLSRNCDEQTGNNDGYVNCVCNSTNAQFILNSCAACVDQNERGDDRTDNDVTDLMRDCGWTYSQTSQTSTAGSASTRTSSPGSSVTQVTTITSSGTTIVSTQTTAAAATTTSSPNAGAVPTAMAGGALVGAAVAALAWM
ncbi:hypothetical protein BKA67DRAFT_537791 [Truncatella angustata]|uniref:Uncharacterized protein n=1 Tax=Truncatella angustata TaxID=152316 RepID=A0A9P8UGX4_9PEZI|nr:uncharacterized protein BKA67DRAFT_537791 [Truncatella angustata]KAH6651938.1 hypothetical protein BKA67DRAFT_537791 [Truncatella angustata]KAH8205665.1 hypothetical protein TruAng_000159 [Truncatella angustata]